MTVEITGIEKTAKGDVYRAMSSSRRHVLTAHLNKEGIVFQAVRRNVTFAEYSSAARNFQRLNDATMESGYYTIVSDGPENFEVSFIVATESCDVVEGVFILRRANKKTVAEAIRRYFGEGSRLLKEGRCHYCNGPIDYDHEGRRRCKICERPE